MATAIPLIVFFFASFHQLPALYRALLTAACVTILVAGIVVLVPAVRQLGRWRAGLGMVAVIATIMLAYESSVLPSLNIQSTFPGLLELGRSMLAGLATAVLIFTMLLWMPAQPLPGATSRADSWSVLRSQLPLLVVLTCVLLGIVYWSQIQTARVYYWDYLCFLVFSQMGLRLPVQQFSFFNQ